MKAKIIAAVVIVAAVVSLESPVQAQSPAAPSVNEEGYRITGDSLEGIDTRTAENDFMNFFEGKTNNNSANNNRNNNPGNKPRANAPRSNRSTSLPTDFIFLQPVHSTNVDGNYGLEIQFRTEN